MIRLLLTHGQEILIFDIHNREIVYRDRKWPNGVRFVPKDEDFVRKVLYSRNRLSNQLIVWINEANQGKNYEEWQNCADDDAVAEIVIRDAKSRGCELRKKFSEQELLDPANFDKTLAGTIPAGIPAKSENDIIKLTDGESQ